jgi:hypothetical protein
MAYNSETEENAAYSRSLLPSGYCLFPELKKILVRHKFKVMFREMGKLVTGWLIRGHGLISTGNKKDRPTIL